MGTTADKGSYLNQTKKDIKNAINNIGGEITDETTFRDYLLPLKEIYDNLPKTDFVEGSNITLENTVKGKIDFEKEFQQVEYIESTGPAYIDTGFIPNTNTKIDIEFETIQKGTNGVIFGGEETYKANSFHLYNSTEMFDIGFGSKSTDFKTSINYNTNIKYTLIMDKNGFDVNGSTGTFPEPTISTNSNIFLFAVKRASSMVIDSNAQKRIYYCKLYNNGTLVRDYIPCYRISDNVIGMYDLVNNKFYINAGTGTFTKGTDAGNGFIEKVGYGDTSQDSYEGYNLLKVDDTPSTTQNGITWSISNNVVTINGTTTAGFAIPLTTTQPVLVNGQTYTAQIVEISGSCTLNTSATNPFRFIFYTNNTNTYAVFRDNIIGSFTSNTATTESQTRLWIGYDGVPFCTFSNYKFKLLLVKGSYTSSTIPSWEPYTNGPAPNPSYPQEIEVVRGKNLAQLEFENGYRNYGTGNIISSGSFCSFIAKVSPNNEYYASNVHSNLCYLDINKNRISGIGFSGGGLFNTNNMLDVAYVSVAVENSKKDSIQIEKGSQATSYLPYNTQEVTIRGINLLNIAGGSVAYKPADTTVTINNDGVINASTDMGYASISIPNITLKAGTTYTFKRNFTGSYNSLLVDTNGNNVLGIGYNKTSVTATIESDVTINKLNGALLSGDNYFQLETGSTATDYEPYITPITKTLNLGNIELAKIGAYRDYIWTDRETKKWYKHSEIRKRQITGNDIDNLRYSNPSNNCYQYRTAENFLSDLQASPDPFHLNDTAFCNYSIKNGDINDLNNYHFTVSGNKAFCINTPYNTLENMRTWVNSVDLILYYQLATATDTEITDTSLINQLEEIYNIMSNNGTTIIEINGTLPMIIKARANTESSQPSTETKTVKSTTESQTVNPTSGKLISQITVQPIVLDTVSVTPSTSSQTINPTHDGIGQVNVSAVTSSIDNNIVAGNIKKDVSILGVTGTYEGGSSSGGNVNVEAITSNNMYKNIATVDLSDVELETTSLNGFFSGYTALKEVTMPNTSNITNMANMFGTCVNLENVPNMDTSNVTTMENMFLMHSSATTMQGKITEIPLFNTANVTNMSYMVACTKITSFPQLNTGKVTNMNSMFYNCRNLVTVPVLDTSKLISSGMSNMFKTCNSLSNDSLNNILAMCTAATLITTASYKTLKSIGLSSAQATTCQSLSNYAAFTDAGWTTGY